MLRLVRELPPAFVGAILIFLFILVLVLVKWLGGVVVILIVAFFAVVLWSRWPSKRTSSSPDAL